jgi:hypothetical protein
MEDPVVDWEKLSRFDGDTDDFLGAASRMYSFFGRDSQQLNWGYSTFVGEGMNF